jgi:hypothetical protein
MNQASVAVHVEDSARAPIASASVTLRSPPRGPRIKLAQTSAGNYSARSLDPGPYRLRWFLGYVQREHDLQPTVRERGEVKKEIVHETGLPVAYNRNGDTDHCRMMLQSPAIGT